MIPNIFHQTWKTKSGLSEARAFWRNSFVELNPDFTHNLYDDADNAQIVKTYASSLLPVYQAFPLEIYRVDFVRALYLFCFGGFYADLDFQCLQPFAKYCPANLVIFGRMGTVDEFDHVIPNAMMASPQYDGFWIFYLKRMVENQSRMMAGGMSDVEHVTGPVALKSAIMDYRAGGEGSKSIVRKFLSDHAVSFDPASLCFNPLFFVPPHVWYPINWNDKLHAMFRQSVVTQGLLFPTEEARKLFPYSDAVTYWEHGWDQPA
jgi:mannosyltransferase OCH1-like enzyme